MYTLLILKIIHIVGFVSWFAGLFYLVRLFVYHTDAYNATQPKKEILRQQFALMEARVYSIICKPAMVITWLTGLSMIYFLGKNWFSFNTWLHVKIVFVLLLTAYHVYCKKLMIQLKSKTTKYSSIQFRYINEIPTVILVIIVALAILKNNTNPLILLVSIIIFVLIIIFLTKLYKNLRKE